MKSKKIRLILGAVCAISLSSAIAAFPSRAATAFDPNYYFHTYPDVGWEIGYDEVALFNHYQNFGMAEGRFPNIQAEWNAAAGLVATEEDRTAFLMQIPASEEKPEESDLPKFNPIFYYNRYPDVAAIVGGDAQALLNHYFAYGYSEGRLPFNGAEPCTDVQTSF